MSITHCKKCGWQLPEPSANRPDTAQEVACPNPGCDWHRDADRAPATANSTSSGAGLKRRPRLYPTRPVHEHRHNGRPQEESSN